MYTINIRGKMNPKDQKMVKLELIFFKTGYARVPKVLNITGLLKNWDAKSQCFKTGTPDATTKNKLLFDIKTKYLHVIDTWESEGRNWSPVEVSHYFDVIKQNKPEVKVKSVVQMIDSLILRFNEKKRIKNGQIIDSSPNARIYMQMKRSLSSFTKEKYDRAFSSYYFIDITYIVRQFQADSFESLRQAVCRICDSPRIRSRHEALMYIVWMAALDIKERRVLRHTEAEVKITRDDGFVWLIVPREKVRGLWETGTFTLYRLYADDSEAEIENKEQLEETLERGYSVGIEVGFVATMGYAARMHR